MMKKTFKIIIIFSFFILNFFSLGFSQENWTISTYYPSPIGVYRVLKLDPGAEPVPAATCENGQIYYKNAGAGVNNIMCLCINHVWERLLLSGDSNNIPGLWTESAGNIYNTGLGGNVGMGTNAPNSPLTISGGLNVIHGNAIFQQAVAINNAAPAYTYDLEVKGTLHATGYFSSDESPGMSGIIPVLGNAGPCTITVKDGLVVGKSAGC